MKQEKQSRMYERAELCFVLLCSLGPNASLKTLYEHLKAAGFNIARSTLGRYSARYQWQRRAAGHRRVAAAEARAMLSLDSATVLARRAAAARSLTDAGLRALAALVRDPERWSKVRVGEAARLTEAGLKNEAQALALGERFVTDLIGAVNDTVRAALQAHEQTELIEDLLERHARFAQIIDQLMREALKRRGVDVDIDQEHNDV